MPSLPVELSDLIIDIVFLQYDYRETQGYLSACSLVCKAWRNRAQTHLFKRIVIHYRRLCLLERGLKANPHRHSNITEIIVMGQCNWWKMRSFSSFAIRHKLPNLKFLSIPELSFGREHPLLYQAPMFRSVHRLRLHYLHPCQLSQLIRFIDCFPSLSVLQLKFTSSQFVLQHRGQILFEPPSIDTRRLEVLELTLVPGVFRLIEWLLRAKPLLKHLGTLSLHVPYTKDQVDFESRFEGVKNLVDHCCGSVESFALYAEDAPMVEAIADLCKYLYVLQMGMLLTDVWSQTEFFSKSETPDPWIPLGAKRFSNPVCNSTAESDYLGQQSSRSQNRYQFPHISIW